MTDVLNKNKVFKLWPFLLCALIIGAAPFLLMLGTVSIGTVPLLSDGLAFLTKEPIASILNTLVIITMIIPFGLGLTCYYIYSVFTFNKMAVEPKVSVKKIVLGFIGISALLNLPLVTGLIAMMSSVIIYGKGF